MLSAQKLWHKKRFNVPKMKRRETRHSRQRYLPLLLRQLLNDVDGNVKKLVKSLVTLIRTHPSIRLNPGM
jgi:hypothetical protein